MGLSVIGRIEVALSTQSLISDYLSLNGRINSSEASVIGRIDNEGRSVEGYIIDFLSVNGRIDSKECSAFGRFGVEGVSVIGEL